MLELDADEIYRVLLRHELDFLIVGAAAVAVHGFPRATRDVDIVPAPATGNLHRLMAALRDLKARPLQLGDFEANGFPRLSVENLAGGANWCLATRAGRLDVVQFIDGVLESASDYTRLSLNAVDVKTTDGTLYALGFEDLVRFKEVAGRDIDLIDLRALYEARGDTGPR